VSARIARAQKVTVLFHKLVIRWRLLKPITEGMCEFHRMGVH
jgi:hypothetical protein